MDGSAAGLDERLNKVHKVLRHRWLLRSHVLRIEVARRLPSGPAIDEGMQVVGEVTERPQLGYALESVRGRAVESMHEDDGLVVAILRVETPSPPVGSTYVKTCQHRVVPV